MRQIGEVHRVYKDKVKKLDEGDRNKNMDKKSIVNKNVDEARGERNGSCGNIDNYMKRKKEEQKEKRGYRHSNLVREIT